MEGEKEEAVKISYVLSGHTISMSCKTGIRPLQKSPFAVCFLTHINHNVNPYE